MPPPANARNVSLYKYYLQGGERMSSLDDFLLYAAYTGVKKGIEKLSKGKITGEDIDNRVERKARQLQKEQDKVRKKLEQ